jgi:CRP/FNR family transcriptional regulator, cyclic AMP receptor protein
VYEDPKHKPQRKEGPNTPRHVADRWVWVLDADPDLGSGLDQRSFEVAKGQIVAPLKTLGEGSWKPMDLGQQPGYLGMLVIDGLLARDVALANTVATELVGPTDLLRPSGSEQTVPALPADIAWTVVEPTRVAVLDGRFTAALARWPAIISTLLSRSIARSQSLAFNLTVSHMTGIETRLVGLFWHLAERFGRVNTEGVVVPLALTHDLLGRLVGAKRPTVTSALAELDRRDLIKRRATASWLLLGEPPPELVQRHDVGRRSSSAIGPSTATGTHASQA